MLCPNVSIEHTDRLIRTPEERVCLWKRPDNHEAQQSPAAKDLLSFHLLLPATPAHFDIPSREPCPDILNNCLNPLWTSSMHGVVRLLHGGTRRDWPTPLLRGTAKSRVLSPTVLSPTHKSHHRYTPAEPAKRSHFCWSWGVILTAHRIAGRDDISTQFLSPHPTGSPFPSAV